MQVKVKLNEVKFLFRTLSNFEAFGGHLTVIYIELVLADFPYLSIYLQTKYPKQIKKKLQNLTLL